jgi:homoserine dehydrogenase
VLTPHPHVRTTPKVEGIDTANKLVIIANAVLQVPAKLSDVHIEGISSIDAAARTAALDAGAVIRLVATAVPAPETTLGYSLSVKCASLCLVLARVRSEMPGLLCTIAVLEDETIVSARTHTSRDCGA